MSKKKEIENEEVIENDTEIENEEVVKNEEVTTKNYKLEVVKKFKDKYDNTIQYKVGDILTIDDENRKNDLVKRHLARVIKD